MNNHVECISRLILYPVVILFWEPCNPHLEEIFKREYGVTPMRYLKHCRFQQARDLMRNGSHSVNSATLQSGFWELGRFAVESSRIYGEIPSRTLLKGRMRG